jgi:hypothetical protein
MTTMQERQILDYIRARSTKMIVAEVCLPHSNKSCNVAYIKVFVEAINNETGEDLRKWLLEEYYQDRLFVGDDMSDDLYLLISKRFFNRETVIEITQDGKTGQLTRYATTDY